MNKYCQAIITIKTHQCNRSDIQFLSESCWSHSQPCQRNYTKHYLESLLPAIYRHSHGLSSGRFFVTDLLHGNTSSTIYLQISWGQDYLQRLWRDKCLPFRPNRIISYQSRGWYANIDNGWRPMWRQGRLFPHKKVDKVYTKKKKLIPANTSK